MPNLIVYDLLALCRGLKLDYILNTHHHWDHTGGTEELKRKFNCTIVGPKADQGRIPGIDIALADGESWKFGNLEMHVFDTPGHTRGHITLWFPQIQALFPGKLAHWHDLQSITAASLMLSSTLCLCWWRSCCAWHSFRPSSCSCNLLCHSSLLLCSCLHCFSRLRLPARLKRWASVLQW